MNTALDYARVIGYALVGMALSYLAVSCCHRRVLVAVSVFFFGLSLSVFGLARFNTLNWSRHVLTPGILLLAGYLWVYVYRESRRQGQGDP